MKIKMSTAIRRGAAVSLPLNNGAFKEEHDGNIYACALMAAYLGIGGSPSTGWSEVSDILKLYWPELERMVVDDEPDWGVRAKSPRPLAEAIWVRNDHLYGPWSRERLADWLEVMGL